MGFPQSAVHRVGDQQLVASVSYFSKGPKTNVLGSRQEGDVPGGSGAEPHVAAT